MGEMRILSPTGVLGSGFAEISFEAALARQLEDAATYERVKRSGALSRETVATSYGVSPEQVKFFFCDNALAIKTSIPRSPPQRDLGDADGHGGQQYAP